MGVQFHHYIYVLRCADGSYYAGYSTDVEQRVATHNAGRGAKYTQTRLPVELCASARFFTKERAMSAEYRFKQLTRAQKEALLERAKAQPFEEVLEQELSGFAPRPCFEVVAQTLCENQDEEFRRFHARLIPSVDPARVVGVRTPVLRKLGRTLARCEDAASFYASLPHALYEEDQVHAFAISTLRDYDQLCAAYEDFLPFIDNWATCDQLPTAPLAKDLGHALDLACAWMRSSHAYTVRFGIKVIMRHFLTDRFEPRFLALIAETEAHEGLEPPEPGYYINMMRAWAFAEAFVAQPQAALPWLEGKAADGALDEWTRRKAIRKALESRKVTSEDKAMLRSLLQQ